MDDLIRLYMVVMAVAFSFSLPIVIKEWIQEVKNG